MMDPYEARRLLLEGARPLAPEDVSPPDALGRWLARPIHAPETRPAHDNSAMDGFAVRAADTANARRESPVRLAVVGESRVGRGHGGAVAAGEAVRISTGGPVPEGADAVVPVEHADAAAAPDGDEPSDEVAVLEAPSAGAHIRRRGEELQAGDEMLPRGLPVNPAAVGLLSSLELAAVPVHRRPRVAALVTGDEFLQGARDANGPLLEALCRRREVELTGVEHVGDRADELAAALERRAREADVVVTTGGASVGPHDVVAEAWEAVGARTLFWKVAVKPGKPVRAGVLPPRAGPGVERAPEPNPGPEVPSTFMVALPGNPQSVLAGFEFFVEPLLRRLAGAEEEGAAHLLLPLAREIPSHPRTRLLRGRLARRGGESVFDPPPVQGRGMLTQAARCPLVAEVGPSTDPLPAGTPVRVRAGLDGLAGRSWVPAPGDVMGEEPALESPGRESATDQGK